MDSNQLHEETSNDNVDKKGRLFTIRKREKAMSEDQKAKNKSALIAGLCTLTALTSGQFSGILDAFFNHELKTLSENADSSTYVWGAIGALSAIGACVFLSKYFNFSETFKDVRSLFVDMNRNSDLDLNSPDDNNLGGEKNAKTK